MSQEDQIVEKICSNKLCLEIAPGKGKFLKIDPINRVGIEINKSLSEELQSSGLNCINANFFSYETDAKYDVVYARNFIEHLHPSDLASFLAKCDSLLSPNGHIVLVTPVESVIWRTASHIRPYPPIALKKLLYLETEQYLFPSSKISKSYLAKSYCTFRIKSSRLLSFVLFLVFNFLNRGQVLSSAPFFGSHYITILSSF